MGKLTFIILLFFISLTNYAQVKPKFPIDTLRVHLLSVNYRVFELAIGAEMKYFYFKKMQDLAPTLAAGYSAISNNVSVKNSLYSANGAFAKIGVVHYTKYIHKNKIDNATIYVGINSIYSYSNQIFKPTFTSQYWGTYQEVYNTTDFNIGIEGAMGIIVKIHNKIFLQAEGSLGIKMLNTMNPIKEKFHSSNPDYLPYYTPGMGRGGPFFINFCVGVGYQF
ncbi:MAG: hypothetical protein ACOYMA_04855 [Bacteroidia bacterium]